MSSLKLTSFTPLNAQTKKKVITIWKTIYDSNDSLEFRNPLDWRGMGLLDYLKYVPKPMDLNTISRQLRQQKYRTVQNVLDDIQLIFDNCKAYNAQNSWFYNLADKLEKSFIKMICNFMPKIVDANIKSKIHPDFEKNKQIQVPQQPMQEQVPFFIEEVSYNDKIKFTDKLTHINSQNLQKIVNKILQKNADSIKILPKQQAKVQMPINNEQKQKSQQQQNKPQGERIIQNQEQKLAKNDQNQNKEFNEVKEINQPVMQSINPQIVSQPKSEQNIKSEQKVQQANMEIEQAPKERSRRVRSSRNIKYDKKQNTKNVQEKMTVAKWQVGTKAQIFIDDLNYQSFEQLMKMLQGMVEQKDKTMKKIKLD